MGTNYYAHIIPTKERKDEIKKAIDNDDFPLVTKLLDITHGNFRYSWEGKEFVGGVVHLGKASYGWKFLWNPNIYLVRNGHMEYIEYKGGKSGRYIIDPDTAEYLYPLTKKGIKSFIDRDDIEIYDEYNEKQNKEEFWQMAVNHTTWRDPQTENVVPAWDADTYIKEHPKEKYRSCENDYTDLLEKEGFKLSRDKSDFYSDGLRFATSIEFS